MQLSAPWPPQGSPLESLQDTCSSREKQEARMAESARSGNCAKRDHLGRFLPGVSGNPRGRRPGRPPNAVNDLADLAVMAVMRYDLDCLASGRLTPPSRTLALDRLARLSGKRITASDRAVVGEAGLEVVVQAVARRIAAIEAKYAALALKAGVLGPGPSDAPFAILTEPAPERDQEAPTP